MLCYYLTQQYQMKKVRRNKMTVLNDRFDDLHIREIAIRNRFDPVRKHQGAHIYIDDLRQDYVEEVNNLGFSKFEKLIQLSQKVKQHQILREIPLKSMNKEKQVSPHSLSSSIHEFSNWKFNKRHGVDSRIQVRNKSANERLVIRHEQSKEKNIDSKLYRNSIGSAPSQMYKLSRKKKRRSLQSNDSMRTVLDQYEQLILQEQKKFKDFKLSHITFAYSNRQWIKSAPFKKADSSTRNQNSNSDLNFSIQAYKRFFIPLEKQLQLRAVSELMFKTAINPVSYHNIGDTSQFIYDKKLPVQILIISSQGKIALHLNRAQLGKRGIQFIHNRELVVFNPYELCQYIKLEEAGKFNLVFQILMFQRNSACNLSLLSEEYFSVMSIRNNRQLEIQFIRIAIRALLIQDPSISADDLLENINYYTIRISELPSELLLNSMRKEYYFTDIKGNEQRVNGGILLQNVLEDKMPDFQEASEQDILNHPRNPFPFSCPQSLHQLQQV